MGGKLKRLLEIGEEKRVGDFVYLRRLGEWTRISENDLKNSKVKY